MVAFPLAGWLGEGAGFGTALIALCALAALGLVAAWHAWPAEDPMILAHRHDDPPVDHPHLREHPADVDALRHAHPYTIDDLHPRDRKRTQQNSSHNSAHRKQASACKK